MIYFAYRDGKLVLSAVNLEKADDGTLWGKAGKSCPLINQAGQGELTKEQIVEYCNKGQFDKLPKEVFCKEGMNLGGLEVITLNEHQARAKAKRDAARTPAQIEREAIIELCRKSEAEIDNPHDSILYWKYKNEASARFEKWKRNYPNGWKREQAEDLMSMAERQKSLAVGALVYDMDGSLSAEDQKDRHDKFMQTANEMIKKAEALLKEIA